MEKRPSESFRQHAQRWREVATQVWQDRIRGRSQKDGLKKREGDVNNVSARDKSVTLNQPSTVITDRPSSHKHESNTKPNGEKLQFTPIYMTYGQLYQKLYDTHVVAPHYLQPLQPPYPKWYDANAQCEYHVGIVGHSIENCLAFKKLVEKLIQMGVVKVNDTEHPLPNHANNGVNMMGGKVGKGVKMNVEEIKTLLRWVWKQMINRGLITQQPRGELEGAERYCEFHAETGHNIQECLKFRVIVQNLMDNKEMEFYEEIGGPEEGEVHASEEGSSRRIYGGNRPTVIISRPRTVEVTPEGEVHTSEERSSRRIYGGNRPAVIISRPRTVDTGVLITPKVIIQKPVASPYRDNKKVPWSYDCKVVIPGKDDPVNAVEKDQDEGFFTRSGRRYTPNTRAKLVKGKSVITEQNEEGTMRPEALVNEPMTESEAKEFLKFLKHSEYSVVEQLHKQPARVSILDLLRSSETHRNALMKTLNETYVAGDISISKLDRLVGNISADNFIFFNDDEIPSGGAVPSSLYQKLKLVAEGRLVTINAEENIIASVTSDAPYIEVDEEAMECSFRSLEFINATFIVEGSKIPIPRVSKSTKMCLQMTVGKGALPGKGLGKTKEERGRKEKAKKKGAPRRRRDQMGTNDLSSFIQNICLRGIIYPDQSMAIREEVEDMLGNLSINAISEGKPEERDLSGIRPYAPRSVLNNWTVEEIPVAFRINSESPDINGMSDTVINSESPFEQDMEQEEKQILPHKELVEIVSLGEGKELKIGANITAETKQDLIKLLQEFKDVFAWDLNKASSKDNFPLPHIDTLVDNTAGYSLFSFMDGFSGYNQIKMHPEDMEKTTFITMWGTFCYKVMSFGLKNAGATYQRAMVTLFHDMMHKEIEVYMDDMIAKSKTEEEHVQILRKLFLRLRKFQLKLNPSKCTFGARSGKLLGFVVSEKGIEVDPDKVKAIQELSPPRTQKEVRGFLGILNYIARFIAQLTEKCDPIFRLLRKHNPDRPLILYLSVFENSMGCVLGQHDESGKKERAIYYLSKKFTECKTRYSPIEKLCCALIWTTRRLRQYILYHTTWLISKLDPLKYMMESTALDGRITRWQILLSEFDIVYINQKAVKGSAIADFLASRALEDYEPLEFDFPNEDLMYVAITEEDVQKEGLPWKLNFDGASNAIGNGIGAVLVSPDGDHYPLTSKLDFDCTNNMAEYEACILGIRAAIERKIKILEVYNDSVLVIYQLKGEWETRDPKLISYRSLVLELIKEFDNVAFCYLPREENQMADALATLASMIKVNKQEEVKPIQMSIYEVPAHCYNIREEEEKDDHPWTLRRLASDYALDGEILYKRRKDQILLRCVDAVEAKRILEEVHEGVCGIHANGFTMARQIMRFGYYWSTMEGDCISYAKKCHKCKIYGDKIHVPSSPLHVMTSPWPFSIWGMDVIGPISPKALNGHRFIFVVIDYFTKWVEATSYANVTKSAVSKFLKKEIICRYGMPERIISSNALNLNNSTIAEVCSQFKIKHHNLSPYRPKMNGAVEAANKNIKKIVGKMTETYRDWHDKLPFALYAYRTSIRTSTGTTPFSLVYRMEAVLPIEVEIPSLRVFSELKLDEAEWTQSRYDQLNLIEEKRLRALRHGQMYQKRMIRAYNKKVRPREFYEGDLVPKKILPLQKDFRGKWMPNWEGPYVVKKAFSGGSLILAEMDGKSLPNPVNSDSVKKYFA
ncbi:RNA-directed DNA polymerase (Reverse transcriptase), Ribonuclease H [Gossypium australe]|uniref:RNA-directed DNA polymerase (Reverse transcriptase), Ribonuclease H n=1 Tax=Gossypium australe TaxID=47621 RepID=A0A5B6V7N1_9ROSI|nr:RNA-directed DNA polymerase (Reverse transcriptase), Ribonuclease H [Gossypium australe]